jgi:hypothetical protein
MRMSITTIFTISALASSASFAELYPMTDIDMAKLSGKGVIEVSETLAGQVAQPGGIDVSFTRITIGADIDINANINRLVLGEGVRQDGLDNSDDADRVIADIDFANISLGTVGPNGVVHDFKIVDPYIEFARNNTGDLIGFRLGFGEVNGTMGVEIQTLSGDVQAVGQLSLGLFSINLDSSAHNVREDDITDDLLGIDIDLGNFKNLTFTGTNNFYLGLQSTAINYPKLGAGPQGTAQSGFWLNLQDGVTSPGLGLDSIFPISVSNELPVNRFTGYY